MEPVFMGIGQAAAIAALLAIRGGTSVQDVPYAELRRELDAVSLVAEWPEVAETIH
jgi:acetyl-CoA acetyltransferase